MEVVQGSVERQPVAPIAIILASLAVLTLSVVGGVPLKTIAPVSCIVVIVAIAYRVALRWSSLIAFVIGWVQWNKRKELDRSARD